MIFCFENFFAPQKSIVNILKRGFKENNRQFYIKKNEMKAEFSEKVHVLWENPS